jgi:hypothetical protein
MTDEQLHAIARECNFGTYTYQSGAIEYSGARGSDGMEIEDLRKFAEAVLRMFG